MIKNDKWLVAISISFGSLMATIDTSIVNVAIPYIRGNVGASIEEITWVSTSYIIAMVLVMPLTGIFGALFGQKRFYLASLIVFITGSFLCGLARTLESLILFRILQGFGAGALQPMQQAILKQVFPQKEQGMAMAVFSMIIMAGPAIGPTLGGWLTDNYSWPWIFYVNLPIGLAGIFCTWKNYTEPKELVSANQKRGTELKKNMDWIGIALLIITVSSMQYCLEEGNQKDWFESSLITASAIIFCISCVFLIIREFTYTHPILNLRVFADRTFLMATLVATAVFSVLMGSMFILPLFMQELLGFNATLAGLTMMPRAIAMMVCAPIVGRLYNEINPVLIMAFGAFVFVISAFMQSHLTLQSSSYDIILTLIFSGIGISCLFVPIATIALTFIPEHQIADAAGLNSFARQIGGSIGIAVFATLLTQYSEIARKSISWHFTLLRPEFAQGWAAQMKSAASLGYQASQQMLTEFYGAKATVQGTVLAFEKIFLLQGVGFLCVIPLFFLLKVDTKKLSDSKTDIIGGE
jgi:DHA2 family multidrug resistance protein